MSNECCKSETQVVLTPEIVKVIKESPYVALVSVSAERQPHLIVVGKVKEVREDNCIVFGVYKMEKTRKNISETGLLQAAVVSGKAGYRFAGRACVVESEVILSIEKIELLL
jgi:predicted pyridoxine 5'-phosphate oxidase superfamily flavin-nucleotide-binding protein